MSVEKYLITAISITVMIMTGSCTAYNINKENLLASKDISCMQIAAIVGDDNTLRVCKDAR